MNRATSTLARQVRVLPPTVQSPLDAGRPLRIGVISNPSSGKNVKGKHFEEVRRHCTSAGVKYHEVDALDDMVNAAHSLASEGSEIIVVNGGDGTVEAVLSGLLHMGSLERLPVLALLPAGSTNMTAADVSGSIKPIPALDRLLSDARAGRLTYRITERQVVRVTGVVGHERPICGMFFGAGAVYHGIQFCRRYIHTIGLRGDIGPGIAMMVFIGKLLAGQKGDLLPPLRLRARLDQLEIGPRDCAGLFLSTLDHLFLHMNPFWGREPGALRCTVVDYSSRHKLRVILPIMRGKPTRFVSDENGYVSHNSDSIEMHIDGGFTVDGELFGPQPGIPLTIDGRARAYFLHLGQ